MQDHSHAWQKEASLAARTTKTATILALSQLQEVLSIKPSHESTRVHRSWTHRELRKSMTTMGSTDLHMLVKPCVAGAGCRYSPASAGGELSVAAHVCEFAFRIGLQPSLQKPG